MERTEGALALPVIESVSGCIRAVLVEFPSSEELSQHGALIGSLGEIIVRVDQSRLILDHDLVSFAPVFGELIEQGVSREHARIHGDRNSGEGLLPGAEEFSGAGLLADPSLDDSGQKQDDAREQDDAPEHHRERHSVVMLKGCFLHFPGDGVGEAVVLGACDVCVSGGAT